MKEISTKYGNFIPQHTDNELRRKEILPITYHASGAVKSLPLEKQALVTTPVGDIPAELITFHSNGGINRIFPLNGKLSGYWSQDDEAALAEPVTIETPIGSITARIISLSFYENEALRSVTLWPGDTVSVSTPVGFLEVRIGISFTPDGKVSSVEPAKPAHVETPAGVITAFDPDAVGVNGDENSLVFDKNGEVTRVTTTLTRLKAIHPDGAVSVFTPATRESLCSEAEEEIVPMTVFINGPEVAIRTKANQPPTRVPREKHVFFTEPYLPQLANSLEMMRCSV
ncbi:hypothetical protein GM415_09375 [Pseudodesulfovibrio cashew]|uniref:Uncharacterized protein n=1 Tax=Pseudodesulfovibrio cashew TaxID=2678688 RepID=A0A6I6JJM3_9BACT|nr:hypothetical protein [Pseudodesulfovibrio cashew]QGY40327.1 hypothetical protein GM415_09375 [Pseudodesulfovibrio cashew]